MLQPQDRPLNRARKRTVRRRLMRRSLRTLRERLNRTHAALAALAGLVVLAVVFALALAARPEPEPDPIVLGQGRAGVMGVALTEVDTTARPAEAAPPLRPGPRAPRAEPAVGSVDSGEASYYGDELRGNRTASGERFNPDELTAAHRSLPLGSRLRVTNLRTGQSVIVRVNDRGPFAGDRVLDVSEQAARRLGMLQRGTARVRLELLLS